MAVSVIACRVRSWLSVVFVAVSTGYALANPNPNAFGPHNFADYTAIVVLLVGALLWLLRRVRPPATARPSHGTATESPAPRESAIERS